MGVINLSLRRRQHEASPIPGRAILDGLRVRSAPFDPETGEIKRVSFERQAELVLDQMKQCLEAAGSSLDRVVKCNVYCADATHFDTFNGIYARYFPVESPARTCLCVAPFPGPLDIEVDCVAVV